MQNSVAKKLFAVGSAVAMTLSLAVPFVTHAAPDAAGTNVSSPDGTVWMIMPDGTRRAYTSAGAFLSYGFNSWSSVVPASADDLALPTGSFIPPQDGSIICSNKGSDQGTCYDISSAMKYGFTSAAVFTGLGFSFANSMPGDVSWMPAGTFLINSSTQQHLTGTLINNNGTVQLVGPSGLLGIPDVATFNSWGYSFSKVVPANAADQMLTQTGVMVARIAGQLSPVWTTTPGTPSPSPSPSMTPGGALSVSLSSATPASTNFPVGAAFIPFTAINFAASSLPVTVTTLTLHRSGLGADNNFNNAYLFNGNIMVGQSSSFQNAVVTFTNSNGLFTVPANTTMTIWVKADVAAGVNSGLTYTFGLNGASDITSNATSVSGTFPLMGNLMTSAAVSNPNLATLVGTAISTGSSVNAGTPGFLVGQWTLASSNSSVQVKGINFTLIGSASPTAFANMKLMANGTQVGTTQTSVGSNGLTFFDLSGTPLQIPAGQTIQLQLFSDIVGGVNRTYQFSIQHNYDVQAYDTTYNVGILSTGSFPLNSPSSAATINQGSLTITRDPNSRNTSVAASMTNVALATFDFTSNGEDVKILTLPISITVASSTNSLNSVVLNNIKLVDNTGYGIGSAINSQTTVSSSGSFTNTFGGTSSLNYVVPAGTTRKVSIVADLNSIGANVTSISASLAAGTAQGVTSVASIVTGAATGNALSVAGTALSGVQNSAVVSPVNVVPNQAGAKIASFALTAGGADGVNVSVIQLTTATSSVLSNFQNLRIQQGTTPVGQVTNTLSNSQTITVSPTSPIMIPAGGSTTFDVYADVLSSATANLFNNRPLVFLSAVTAQYATSGASVSLANTPIAGQGITVVGNGAVTISQSPSTPVTRQQAMGQTGVNFGVIKFLETTGNEGVTLQNLTITATAAGSGVGLNANPTSFYTLNNFTITATDGSGNPINFNAGTNTKTISSWSTGTDGSATANYTLVFNNVNIPIPQGPSAYLNLTVKANTNSFTQGGGSASTWVFGLVGTSAATLLGTASNANITPTLTSNASSNTTTVYRTTLGFGSVASISSPVSVSISSTGQSGSAENMAIFSVTNAGVSDAVLQTITLQQGGTAPTSAATTYSIFDASQGLSSAVGTGTLAGTTAGAITLNLNSAAASTTLVGSGISSSVKGVIIPAGSTKYLVVQANTSNPAFNTQGSGSTKTYSLTLNSWTWSDETTANIGVSGDASTVSSAVNKTY